MKVAFLGPVGTYTHEVWAVIQQFGANEELSLYPQKSIDACFEILDSDDEIDFAVVPFENSTNGQVVFTYDLLRDWFIGSERKSEPKFRIVGEQFVSIHHYLSSRASDLAGIKTIYSHPQVWGQVTNFLKGLSGCNRVDVSSTAEAAKLVSQDSTSSSACISSKTGAELNSLQIIAAEIEDNPDNTTRFLILGCRDLKGHKLSDSSEATSPSVPGITSIMFALNHNDPGALMSALDAFRSNNINLTSITSRPSRKNRWDYVFFVEAEGSIESEGMKSSLNKLDEFCTDVVLLGAFVRTRR